MREEGVRKCTQGTGRRQMVDDGQQCPRVCGGANALKECGLMLDRRLGGQERGLSYLLTHLLLFGRMGLHVLAE